MWGPGGTVSTVKQKGEKVERKNRLNRARSGSRDQEEKRKERKDHEGGSKKRKKTENDNSLASMFAKQQAVRDLNKTRDIYNAQVQKGKEIGLSEPGRRSEKDTHDISSHLV